MMNLTVRPIGTVLMLLYMSPLIACGWWGDGESDGAEDEIVITADGREKLPENIDWSDSQRLFEQAEAYRMGTGLEKEIKKAITLYQEAALMGHSGASYTLGKIYAEGVGVAKDPVIAGGWYRLAAGQGEVHSQHHLAQMYALGTGVPKSERLAIYWFGEAARSGHAEVFPSLAQLLWTSEKPYQDKPLAYMWWTLAARLGDVESQKRIKQTASQITSQQRTSAEERAAEFYVRFRYLEQPPQHSHGVDRSSAQK